MLLLMAVRVGVRTTLASFYILGPIPSRPIAFAEFSPFMNSETLSTVMYGTLKKTLFGILELIKVFNFIRSGEDDSTSLSFNKSLKDTK